ncbi:hypothetical protein HYQ45_004564 [Verticillium longisporum]|uniref:Uncharacterized protein n=1 Tax=Verticillium longisporum TaxID=100787 RepID=A0A8I2ZVW0_VERLO|nr:hypothetical protein HYQ45_004564 [Verticillium longisporum]
MIQIALEADDAVQASVLFAELLALSHKAGTDVELTCAFAKHDAMKSKWGNVKSRFEKVNNRGPLTKDEQQAYDTGFGAVLSEYAKSHTWGETEEFVEEYTQKLGVSLDDTLVNFIADKHGRCREFKALEQWLSYCKDAGFVTTAAFWKSMLVKCKKQWGYGEVEAASLFKTLQEQDIESDFPEAEAVVRSMMIPIQREFQTKRIRIATPKRPIDIGSTFERMKLDAQKGQWKSVLSTYNRAVDTYSIRSTMIQIALEADDAVQASVLFAELLALSHKAGTDVELACAFAKHDAMKSKWDRVKSRFEKVNNRGPLTKDEQQAYDAGFGAVLSEYAKSHTWGETEEFVEEYTQKLRVSLDNTLVNFIADKHGRCREFKALDQWLSYCKDAGFVTTAAFWKSMLVKCKKQWGYGEVEAASLFKTLQEQDIESDFPEAEAVVRSMMIPIQREFPMKRIRIATPKRPMDIGSTFERMKLDRVFPVTFSQESWMFRAVRNGQGYSSGCLQLAVQASMKVNEPSTEHAVSLISKAQSDGHDISNAMVPLVLADLDEIQAVGQQMRDSSEARASGPAAVRPFPAIQRLFSDLLEQGHQIDNFVFHRAAQVCLALRNYREVVTICVFAAQCNGSRDLAYSVWNFSDLCQAFTKQHEYARLRWLMSDVLGRDYRMTKQCRTSLKWVVHYLKRASQADKAEDLKASDRSMLACVEETLKKVSKEKAQWKASERASVAQIVARQNEKQARTPRTEAGGLDYYAPLRRGLDGKPPRWSGRVEEEQEDGSTAVGNKTEA